MADTTKNLTNLVEEKAQEDEKEKAKNLAEILQSLKDQIIPKVSDNIEGTVLDVSKSVVHIDLGKYGLGVVRGRELWETLDSYSNLKVSDKVTATILEIENEEGMMELSFRKASREQAWGELQAKKEQGEVITVKVQGANKGGLLTMVCGIPAFLPVSQLTPEHYPRVEGGDQSRILTKLQDFVNQKLSVKIITADSKDEKLILSEKEVEFDKQRAKLGEIKVGDVIKGHVSGVVDFGAFVKFASPGKKEDEFEGLVHVSELAWQRIDDPADIVRVGQEVEAEIIGIDNTKISLSIKKLQKDPWLESIKKYKVGQKVSGMVTKLTPFGAFVKLDENIHGLIHVSEISSAKIKSPSEALKVGDKKEFKILSIEPEEHRLGLSLRALEEKPKTKEAKTETKSEKPAENHPTDGHPKGEK